MAKRIRNGNVEPYAASGEGSYYLNELHVVRWRKANMLPWLIWALSSLCLYNCTVCLMHNQDWKLSIFFSFCDIALGFVQEKDDTSMHPEASGETILAHSPCPSIRISCYQEGKLEVCFGKKVLSKSFCIVWLKMQLMQMLGKLEFY